MASIWRVSVNLFSNNSVLDNFVVEMLWVLVVLLTLDHVFIFNKDFNQSHNL
jgi:hypothetical protein